MKKDYRKILRNILKKFTSKEYDKFIEFDEVRNKRDYMMIFHGIRLSRLIDQQIASERLQKDIPITDEEYNYYEKLN